MNYKGSMKRVPLNLRKNKVLENQSRITFGLMMFSLLQVFFLCDLQAGPAIRPFTTSGASGVFTYSVYNNSWLHLNSDKSKARVSITKVSPKAKGELVIPSSLDGYEVYGLEESALSACSGVTSISIPSTMKRLKGRALNLSLGLKEIKVHGEHPSFSSRNKALYNKKGDTLLGVGGGHVGEFQILSGTKFIGEGGLSFCTQLTSILVPDGVQDLGGRRGETFMGCMALEKISLPDSVTNIGQKSFQDCKKLKEVAIPSGVTEIPFGVFWRCPALTQVVLPNKISKVGNYAFADCKKLKLSTFPGDLKEIGAYAFKNCIGLKGMALPDSVAVIHRSAFQGSGVLLPEPK